MKSKLNVYNHKLIDLIQHSGIADHEKRTLQFLIESAESSTDLNYQLVVALLNSLTVLEEAKERLIYAEQNRTHPKDILVVGDVKVDALFNQENSKTPLSYD